MIDYIYKEYESVTSTNDVAKQLINEYCPEGTIIYTREQTDGRGRRGRAWQDKKGETLATSLVLYPTLPQEYIPCITLVAALSVRAAIKNFSSLECKIKWPNDVICSDKKICGILTERIFVEGKSAVIVGIGVNVKNQEFPEELEDKATSIFNEVAAEKEEMRRVLYEEEALPEFDVPVAKVSRPDGVKVTFENGGWIIARFSGTEPLLRIFAEAESAEIAASYIDAFRKLLAMN